LGNIDIGRKLIDKKAAAFHRYRMSKSTKDYQIYAKLRNKVTAQLRSDRKNFESKLANDCKRNSKKLFSYYRSKSKLKTVSTNIVKFDGEMSSTNEEAATALNDYFTSVFNTEPYGPLLIFQDRIASEKAILHLELSEFQVQSKLLSLDPGKSP